MSSRVILSGVLATRGGLFFNPFFQGNWIKLMALVFTYQRLIRAVLKHDDVVWQASFSPDNHRIVTASLDEAARLWNAETCQLLAILKHGDDVRWASFSSDGQHIVTASSDDTARMWDAETGRLLAILKHDVRWASFSPDGQRIVTASHKYVHVWRVMTLPQIEQEFGR